MGPSERDGVQNGIPETQSFGVHWAVFLPTVIIALLYAALWFWFTEVSGTSGGMSRAALLVLAVGVPVLMIRAGLRYVVGSLECGPDQLVVRPGWPARRETGIAYGQISELTVKRGLIGRLLDVGTLIITDRSGRRVIMPDLASPERARQALSARADPPTVG